MKQILQNARSGALELVDVPAPVAGPGQVLVRNRFSLVSPGTDKSATHFRRRRIVRRGRECQGHQ